MKKIVSMLVVFLFLVTGVPFVLAQEALTSDELKVASENCTCAECGKKCGSGHETWCSSYQKPKPKATEEMQLLVQTVDPKDLKKSDPKQPSLKTTPPPTLPDPPKKEPSIIDKTKGTIKNKMEKLDTPKGTAPGAVRG